MNEAALVVMKFGGSCLATREQRALAAQRVADRVADGKRVVVVVSAMGRSGDPYATDTLLKILADCPGSPPRESDALASCGEGIAAAVFAALLCERAVPAVSLRGFQAGIITDGVHGDAAVREVRPARIWENLAAGKVVVVAGFQGITAQGEITTLGRGGSDTTAVTLGAALQAQRVEIFTDVDGVRTADPRMVEGTRHLPEITYEESAQLAYKGAQVLHPRAAELAREKRVPTQIRGTADGSRGTWLVPEEGRWTAGGPPVLRATAVTSTGGIAQLTIDALPVGERPELLEQIFGAIAAAAISLDMINVFAGRVAFTVSRERAAETERLLRDLGLPVTVNDRCAKVTLVGGGIHGIPGIMHLFVRALTRQGIAIHQSVDSNMMISVLVDSDREADAVRALHAEFCLPAR